MEEEEHTDRNQQLAKLYQKINIIKKRYLDEGKTGPGILKAPSRLYPCRFWHVKNSSVSDDTDNINQVISSNSPEFCHSYLMELEKKGDPHLDHIFLTRLIDSYTKVFSNMPLGKHFQNEYYARMLVRFAELKA